MIQEKSLPVGPGRRYHSDSVKIDNSTDSKQPGSTMKPLLAYSSTFDILGWSTVHQVNDKKKDYWKNGSYAPVNSDGKYNGKMSLPRRIRRIKKYNSRASYD